MVCLLYLTLNCIVMKSFFKSCLHGFLIGLFGSMLGISFGICLFMVNRPDKQISVVVEKAVSERSAGIQDYPIVFSDQYPGGVPMRPLMVAPGFVPARNLYQGPVRIQSPIRPSFRPEPSGYLPAERW